MAALVDGKAGGNEKTAQGVGNKLAAIEQAREAALKFAQSKLGGGK